MCEKPKASHAPVIGTIRDGQLCMNQEVDKYLEDMFIELEKQHAEQDELPEDNIKKGG